MNSTDEDDELFIFRLVDLLAHQRFEEALDYLGDYGPIELEDEEELQEPLLLYAIQAGAPDFVIRELLDFTTEGLTINAEIVNLARHAGREDLASYLEEYDDLSPLQVSPPRSFRHVGMRPRRIVQTRFDDTSSEETSYMSSSD